MELLIEIDALNYFMMEYDRFNSLIGYLCESFWLLWWTANILRYHYYNYLFDLLMSKNINSEKNQIVCWERSLWFSLIHKYFSTLTQIPHFSVVISAFSFWKCFCHLSHPCLSEQLYFLDIHLMPDSYSSNRYYYSERRRSVCTFLHFSSFLLTQSFLFLCIA